METEKSSDNLQVHPLHRTWKIYLHYPLYTSSTASYGSAAYKDLCKFCTVEDFWRYYLHFPRPSQVFATESRARISLDGRQVEGFGIFQEGIYPEWEKTPTGGHWEIGGVNNVEHTNLLWETLCLKLVGETLCNTVSVDGIRVVDKSKNKRPLYRVEVWLHTRDEDIKQQVLENLLSAIKEVNVEIDVSKLACTWKNHPSGSTN